MSAFAICFRLRGLREVEPWGKPGAKSLHWFGLTDGCYCIDTPAGKLLEHIGPVDPGLGEPWCEYQVARPFEDIVDKWPVIAEQIPTDIIDYFAFWNTACASDDKRASAVDFRDDFDRWFTYHLSRAEKSGANPLDSHCYDVNDALWQGRFLDTLYLQVKPRLYLWRVGTEIHLAWDAEYPWQPSRARLTFPFEQVHSAVALFLGELLGSMSERIAALNQDGWQGEPCSIDLPRLAAEQTERKKTATDGLSLVRATDWNNVRHWLNELDG